MIKINEAALHQIGDDEVHQTGIHQNGESDRRLARIEAQIDRAIGARQPIAAPEYGAPQRDAINSVVDNLVHDVIETITALKRQLEQLEKQVLISSAAAKETLSTQIAVCSRVREQCNQIGEVIGDISQKVTSLS